MSGQRPDDFRKTFRDASFAELVDAFNREVGKTDHVSGRGSLLAALQEALLATGLDCSSFIDINEGSMALNRYIRLDGRKLVPTDVAEAVPDLIYGMGPQGLVFVKPEVVAALIAFNTARTWGELRRTAPELYKRALDLCDGGDFEQEDTSEFHPTQIPAFHDGDFPDFPEQLMLGVIPREIGERFGEVVDTVLNEQMLELDSDRKDEIVAALKAEGFTCAERQDLIDQMSGSDDDGEAG